MREKHVLSAVIQSREAFDSVEHFVERDDLTEQGHIIWTGVCAYFDRDPSAQSIEPDILGESIARTVSIDKHKDMFRGLVKSLADAEVSPANVVDDLIKTKQERIGNQLAAALLAGEPTERLLSDYNEILSATSLGDDEEEDERRGYSVMDLVSVDHNRDNLISIYPTALNDRLDGGVKPGHHLILFARPEMGKTLTVIEMMAGFARQDLTTLYIGNEDPIADINMRLVNRLCNMTKVDVMAKPEKADAEARKQGYENIILKGVAPGTPREITNLLEKHNPHVLVLDQLRNINMSNDNYVLALEEAAKQARQWAKRYACVVVSVTQAGDSASGKAVLDMGDVDFSNTGIPSQADVMIGLGANDTHAKNGELVFSLPKNKVSGVHEYFAVSVEPHLSKLVSLG